MLELGVQLGTDCTTCGDECPDREFRMGYADRFSMVLSVLSFGQPFSLRSVQPRILQSFLQSVGASLEILLLIIFCLGTLPLGPCVLLRPQQTGSSW